MRMPNIDQARAVVAAAYARRHADPVTLELLESLERENAGLRAAIAEKKGVGPKRTGRYVTGLTVAASLLSVGIAIMLYWYQFTENGACFRQGYDAGYNRKLFAGTVSAPPPGGTVVTVADRHACTSGGGATPTACT